MELVVWAVELGVWAVELIGGAVVREVLVGGVDWESGVTEDYLGFFRGF